MSGHALPYVLQDVASILLVDDDPILREFGIVSLATETVTVDAACDGLDALDLLEQRDFSLLLVDLEMPRLDGFGLLERVRANPRWADLPIIVATGREDIEAIDRAYRLGATAFTVKPINWRLMSYQIQFLLRSRPGYTQSCNANLGDDLDRLLALCQSAVQAQDHEDQRMLLSQAQASLTELRSRCKRAA